MTDLAAAIAGFITGLRWEEVPPEIQDHARNRLLDALSTAVASRGVPTTKAIVAVGEALATTGLCTVLPTGRTTAASEAALVNGTAVHSILFEDIHFHSSDHPGAVIVPAALAAAESATLVTGRPATIGDLLRGVLVGYEVHLRMGVIAASGIKARRLRTTSMFGTIGAAATAASIWNLPADVAANAISMAANLSFGFLEGFAHGTAEPYLQAGAAARQGILAVHLARSGVAIGTEAFEGPAGFLQGFADLPAGMPVAFPDAWQIDGVACKPYPISGGKITSTDSAIAAHQQGIDGRRIVSVRALLQPGVKEFPGSDLVGPYRTYAAAQDSTQFCIAAGLLGRDMTSLDTLLEHFDDAEVEALTHKIELVSDPGRHFTRLLIELEGGAHEEVEVDWSELQRPTIEKMSLKLHTLTGGFWTSDTVDAIVAIATGRLDAPVADLSRLLRSVGA
ncbi:MAG TPA: MmgE/PrpD family protein [Pseudolysinimonas sp.]|jgi:2-methylcitrate dehydratase PrpD